MDIGTIVVNVLAIVGGARLIFKGLNKIAKLTKTKKDDRIISKILNSLKDISEVLSVVEEKSDISIKIKQ